MPTPAYMRIEGVSQGLISQGAFTQDSVGNIWQAEHQDEILVEAFQHQIILPTDPQSGQPTGQRVHKPLIITKVFDKASPLLYYALVYGERLTVRIKWYRTAPDGTQQHYFTHELASAILIDIKAYMPNCQDPAMGHFTHLEDLSFTYRKIIWTHEACGTMGEDDWRVPRAR